MKNWKDFVSFANIEQRRASLMIMLVLLSILYATVYTMAISVAYRLGSLWLTYLFLYLVVLLAAYVYMIVMFQFIRNKREDMRTLHMKEYMLPLAGVQTIFYILMAGSSALSLQLLFSKQSVSMVLTGVQLLLMMVYIPLQIFACFAIYDGEKNPLRILKQAIVKLVQHYRSVFYTMVILATPTVLYTFMMDAFFNYGTSFAPSSGVVDIMTRSNPFMDAAELGISVFSNTQLLTPFLLSVLYGLLMCFVLVYFYSFQVCIWDEDVHV